MNVASEALLRFIAHAAAQQRDLASALRSSDLPGSTAIAEHLQAGATLPSACRQVLTPELAAILAGPRPGPAESALLVAEILAARRRRRQLLLRGLAYPGLSLLTLLIIAGALVSSHTLSLPWWQLLLPFSIAGGAAVLICIPALSARWLGGISAWQRHAMASERYQAAALGLRWHLPEARLRSLFGETAARLALTVGSDDAAQDHCALMADHHRRRAHQSAHTSSMLLAIIVEICGGLIALAMASAAWQAIYQPFI